MGIGGIGGGCSSLERDPGRPLGDGSRKVLSVKDPELPRRCRVGLPGALPLDDEDPHRCCIRFVWISPTGVGVVVCERRAAPAAAAARLTLEARFARKACAAAVAAAAVGAVLRGYWQEMISESAG